MTGQRNSPAKLARELAQLQQEVHAVSRARQVSRSSIAVGGVEQPLTEWLGQSFEATAEVADALRQIEAEVVPFVHVTIEEREAAIADADAAVADVLGIVGEMVVLVQQGVPAAEYENAQTLWIDTTIPPGSSTPRNVPRTWDGTTWVEDTSREAMTAAQDALNARGGMLGALAAANAAKAAALVAQHDLGELAAAVVPPLNMVVDGLAVVRDDVTAANSLAAAAQAAAAQAETEAASADDKAAAAALVAAAAKAAADIVGLDLTNHRRAYQFTADAGLIIQNPDDEAGAKLQLDGNAIRMFQKGATADSDDEAVATWEGKAMNIAHITGVETINIGKHQFAREGATGTKIRAL